MKYGNAEIFAAWLVFANKAGPDGRMVPNENEVDSIIQNESGRYIESLAIAQAFVKRVVETEPRNIVEAATGFIREASRINDKIGGILSSKPAGAKTR